MFQAWKCIRLPSGKVSASLFSMNIFCYHFSRLCLCSLIRPNLGLQMVPSLDSLSLALFFKAISPPPSVVFFSENLCLVFPYPHFQNILSFPLLSVVGQRCCR